MRLRLYCKLLLAGAGAFAVSACSGGDYVASTFAGKFVVPNGDLDSAFQGQFTGPHATELIAGWQAPYLDPFDNAWKTMSGVWVGKKN